MAYEVLFDISKQQLIAVKNKLVELELTDANLNVYNDYNLNEIEVTDTNKPNQYECTWNAPQTADYQRVKQIPLSGTNGLNAIITALGELSTAKVVARNTVSNILEDADTNLYLEFGSNSINDWPDHEDYKMV